MIIFTGPNGATIGTVTLDRDDNSDALVATGTAQSIIDAWVKNKRGNGDDFMDFYASWSNGYVTSEEIADAT